jgi:predicted nucleotidyltransferase
MAVPAASRAWVDETVEALVREFHPLKIFLFGSRARGDGREKSDIDLLVVLERIDDKRATRDALNTALPRVPVSVDVFAADTDELARTGDSVGSFVYPVLREGEVVYGVDDRDEHVWLRYAAEDLETAERMLEGRGFALRWACYLAQQAAEKAIKAALVSARKSFPGQAEAGRYPPEQEATEKQARDAVSLARAMVEAARADIGASCT